MVKWGEVDAEYENGINVSIPKGRLQHGKPFGFAFLCLLRQKKGGVHFSEVLMFLLLPGSISYVLYYSFLFFFFF